MTLSKPNTLTLEQIDRALAEWHDRLRLATDNLLMLDDSLTYKRLEGKDGLPPTRLTGVTQAQVTPALAAMHDLFQHIGRLGEVVERAGELRKSLPRFLPNSDTLRQIEQLLLGPSIKLPSARTPLAQRSLMSAAETPQTITPARLLEVMTQAFDVARSAISAVDAAWARLEPGLGEWELQAGELQRVAASLGEADAPDLLAARNRLAALRARVESDPLGVSGDFDAEVRPLLERARARLQETAGQRDRMQAELARARALLAQLNALHGECLAALDLCRQQIADASGLKAPLNPEWLAELERWLATLEDAQRQGRWKAARVGLDRWLQTAGEYIGSERAACIANKAPLELRSELKGRLSALKVKAQARGMAQNPGLSALVVEAETLLRQCPTPVARIAHLVSEYEKTVSNQ